MLHRTGRQQRGEEPHGMPWDEAVLEEGRSSAVSWKGAFGMHLVRLIEFYSFQSLKVEYFHN